MSKLGLIIAGILVGVAISLGGFLWYIEKNYTYQGVLIEPPAAAPEFALMDQNGNRFKLGAQQGKVVLLFFGYTNCPDVCPITLSEFKKVKGILGERAGQVDFVFITVDPERDTPERIRDYLENFDPAFIGLSGTDHELETVWNAYGVYQEHMETEDSAAYPVDHSSRVYAIDKQGQWRLNYPFGMEPERIAQDVIHLLKQD